MNEVVASETSTDPASEIQTRRGPSGWPRQGAAIVGVLFLVAVLIGYTIVNARQPDSPPTSALAPRPMKFETASHGRLEVRGASVHAGATPDDDAVAIAATNGTNTSEFVVSDPTSAVGPAIGIAGANTFWLLVPASGFGGWRLVKVESGTVASQHSIPLTEYERGTTARLERTRDGKIAVTIGGVPQIEVFDGGLDGPPGVAVLDARGGTSGGFATH